MTKRPRRQVYTLDGYLKKVVDDSIRSDQDVQRLAGQWDNSMVNEIVATVLNDEYIPPIILGEQPLNGAMQMYIVDGLQRSTSLLRFRYENYKITSKIENSIVTYLKRKESEDGKFITDEDGNFIWDTIEFDIRGKTYNKLPKELQDKFNEYQLETVIHENCTMLDMSKLIRRYNANRSMNDNQKSFTYVDKFARKIREIINDIRFFKDCGSYTNKEKNNGKLERVVSESIMSIFHLDNWKSNAKDMGKYLNENATEEEFEKLEELYSRLEEFCEDKYSKIFNSKNTFLFISAFERFTRFGLEDSKFAEFLDVFEEELHSKVLENDISWDVLDGGRSTKDKSVVVRKIEFLEKLMMDYFGIGKEDIEIKSEEEFIADMIDLEVEEVKKDMDLYNESLDCLLTGCVRDDSKLLTEENRLSLLTMMAWSYKNDVDIEDWLTQYAEKNNTYIRNSKRNFGIMVSDCRQFVAMT